MTTTTVEGTIFAWQFVEGTVFGDFSFGRGMKHSDCLCVRRDFASQV